MVNAQHYINQNYPKGERGKIKKLWIHSKNLEGKLDLSGFVSLKELHCYINKITNLELKGCKLLNKIACGENNLTDIDLSELPNLTDLYCDDYLFLANKIKGINKTSLIRLDIRQGLSKNQDPKHIWKILVGKFNKTFSEMKLIDISDLNNLAEQVNKESIKDREFLKKIGNEKFVNIAIEWDYKGTCIYLTLDQLANSILARCVITHNRLLNGKDEEWEKNINNLAYESFKCASINPKQPNTFFYKDRQELVKRVLENDPELLSKLEDLPFINWKIIKDQEIKRLENELEIEREHAKNMDNHYQKIIQGLREQLKLNGQKENKATQTEQITLWTRTK